MKLQARLREKRSSYIETSYLRNNDLMVLENVPAEMIFEASQGFMEHESQKHDYLPYFHLIGKIQEIKGSFPFNVTSLYFSVQDEAFLIKDLFYYPSPEELAHIIGTGRFYSRHFQIPTILSANTYTLPCRVDLMIIPPANPAQYEANQYTHFMDLDDEDKTNLPIFYIGITGSGVTRRNDRLLDYYGIDVPDIEGQFVFTAEASGYTDPPLMKYMEAPMISQAAQLEDQHFIENDKEGLLHDDAERQREDLENIVEKQKQEEFHAATPEDALIAQTDREIERRMAERFDGQRMSLAAIREHDRRVQADEDQARPVQEEIKPGRYDGPKELDAREPAAQKSVVPKTEPKAEQVTEPAAPRDRAAEREELRARVEALRNKSKLLPTGKPAPQAVPGKQAEAGGDGKQPVAQDKTKGQRQEVKAVEMDFDPERNATVAKERAESGELTGADKSQLRTMRGADVADAQSQVKVDEAHAAEMSKADAVDKIMGRDVTKPMEEVTEKDAAEQARKKAGLEGKPADEDEYL